MWRFDDQQGNETAKCRWDLVPYMAGRCLDLGAGPYKAFPHFVAVDSCKDTELFGIRMKPDIRADVTKLDQLASGAYGLVYSSHTLEHIEDYKAALREWFRLVKVGGHLALYLPHADYYPKCAKRDEWREWFAANGEGYPNTSGAVEAYAAIRRSQGAQTIGDIYAGTPFANFDHKHDFLPQDIVEAMKSIGGGLDVVEWQERNEGEEYSFFIVMKKLSSGFRESWKLPKPTKTCAIIRYGAIGDNAQTSSVLPWLKAEGYHITFYCQSGAGFETIKHDPHIDRFIIQEKDAVPPQYLSEFWKHEKKKYTKWINLCESVEGTLLACPDRVQFEWPNELRAKYLDRNYLEWTHELAGVPAPYRPKFYATQDEKTWARQTATKWGRQNILWSLAGSSGHKVWPHLDAVVAGLMIKYRDVHIVLVGDESCRILETGWEKEPRVHCQSGKWTIRQSMAFAEVADLIIGTETGLLNAAGGMDAWKIVTLSHSSEEMLTKHWKNVIALNQPQGVGCNKHPCRQLHGGSGFDPWMDCPKHDETGSALCQFHITPEAMWDAVESVLSREERKVA